MRRRIKGLVFGGWGEIIGENETYVFMIMDNGSEVTLLKTEVTDKTVKDVCEDFMWSVFCENGSRKNQIKFIGGTLLAGIGIGAMIF